MKADLSRGRTQKLPFRYLLLGGVGEGAIPFSATGVQTHYDVSDQHINHDDIRMLPTFFISW